MATRRSHRHDQATVDHAENDETPQATEESVVVGPEANGAADETAQSTGQAAGAAGQKPVMQRAEETADRLGESIRHYASIIGFQILRFAARVKEEAEDIWAEAQSIRRGGQPPEA